MNKTIQKAFHQQWKDQDFYPWVLSSLDKGVDSILHYVLLEQPAFDQPMQTRNELLLRIKGALSLLDSKQITKVGAP